MLGINIIKYLRITECTYINITLKNLIVSQSHFSENYFISYSLLIERRLKEIRSKRNKWGEYGQNGL